MKQLPFVVLFSLLGVETVAGQSAEFPNFTLAEITMLRRQDPDSAKTWARYISLAESIIEKAMRERPEIVRQAIASNSILPFATVKIGSKSPDLRALDAAIGNWIADKSPPAALEIELALGRVGTALSTFEPLSVLVDQRERKQKVMAEVIAVVVELYAERLREIEINRGKADRLGPSALNTSKSDRLPRYATRE